MVLAVARSDEFPARPFNVASSVAAGQRATTAASLRIELAATQVLRVDAFLRRLRGPIQDITAAGREGSTATDPVAPRTAPSPSRPLSVLLVGGHHDRRATYADHLRLAGCDVDEADNGVDGLAKALAQPHDLVVADASLAGIDGYDMCRLLRKDDARLDTPFVVVTGDGWASAADRARAAGADAVVVDPPPDSLISDIARLLRNDPAPPAAADAPAPAGGVRNFEELDPRRI
jgi:two-component system chemotaxis response regulator CheY